MPRFTVDRREFLRQSSAVALGAYGGLELGCRTFAAETAAARGPLQRPKVAAVFTAFAHRWHAHVLLENFLEPYLFRGQLTEPGVEVVSFYADQFPAEDMARSIARDYRIPIYPSIAEALMLGGKDLAVDAVLLIGEHGDYPDNEYGVKMYPRKELFDQCAAVMRASGRAVPLFTDKHLSYRWDYAKAMYETAKELKIPLMAGSSVPLAARQPALDPKPGFKIRQAISIHGGPFEMYDIHGLEVLQSVVEGRAGGETGVKSVQLLRGDELWAAADAGRWDPKIAEAALATELGHELPPLRELLQRPELKTQETHGIFVDYADGLLGICLRVGSQGNRFLYGHKLGDDAGTIEATRFYVGPWNNRNLFKALSHAIQEFVRRGEPVYPVERTLLTTGMTLAAVDSFAANGKAIRTDHLAIAYQPTDWSGLRENGESWTVLTEDYPEPTGITRGGHAAEKLKK